MLHESDKPSQEDTRWRNGLETLFGVLAGDKNVIMEFCEKVDWELRDAIGAWGLWVDIRLKREDLP
jgi:nuclear pore complex protein Nup85